jgi:hypothetical protein
LRAYHSVEGIFFLNFFACNTTLPKTKKILLIESPNTTFFLFRRESDPWRIISNLNISKNSKIIMKKEAKNLRLLSF